MGPGGPYPPCGVPGGARLSVARLSVGAAHEGSARVSGERGSRACTGWTRDAAGPRAAGWCTVDRAREGGRKEAADRLGSVKAEVAPTWRLRGSHAGRREEEEGAAKMDGGRRPSSPELVATIRERGSTPERWDGREEVSHRIGFAGGRPAMTNRGGVRRRREKGETSPEQRGFD
uniref:Uncharacterized protein n=1 Tax=Oryza sativa subsp. japonica TaxID=39947 RepID=Q8GS91_ORYSJ|nr:hypothetical protein [Oryza sativa Japonica Group]BAD30254.1 hypothetical protein [Oryza sativa Japonica Group]